MWIRGTGQALDGFTLSSLPEDYASWPSLRRAAEQAYRMAGVGPDDVDLAEVHDCFAIAEIIAYEELGFCAKGEGGRFVEKGLSDYGGKVVVNPRGGLIGCGHPLGATGDRPGLRGLLAASRRGRPAPGARGATRPHPQQLGDGRARRHALRS